MTVAPWEVRVTTRAGAAVHTFTGLTATTTIAVGSNGATLPQATINVAATADFPSAGTLLIRGSTVVYTGKTSSTFTGCTGGTATLATSDLVERYLAKDDPIVALEGQDTCNDISVAHLVLPAEHAANGHMVEDNLAHLYVRGSYVTSYIVKVPQVNPIDPQAEAGENAVHQLAHLLAVSEEGIVEPPAGMDAKPASADRIFDSSDPARDNSDFTTPDELGTVTDAQTNYDVTPYASGMEYPNDVKVIGPHGYGWHDLTPEGWCYFYIDHTFTGGTYRVNGTGDNFVEARVDGMTIQPLTQGFGRAFTVPKINISAGAKRVWARVQSVGPGSTQGVLTLAMEFVELDSADNAVSLELGTSASWKIAEFPATPPGFTPGEILLTTLGEEQALGALTDVTCSFSGTVDSHGDAWSDTYDVSTKSITGLEQFWVREMTAALIDIDAHWDGTHIVLDAWNKGHRVASGVTLTEGSNLGSLVIPGEPRVMDQAAVVWNDGGDLAYHSVNVTPETGHPVRRRPLSLGAARSIEQVVRDAGSQLDLFNRKRQKPTLTHLTNPSTADADVPPSYWKWSSLTIAVTSRWLSAGTLDLVAVTWRLNPSTGQLEFTPEASDLIIPAEVRSGWTLRKLGPPSLGGRARVASYR